MEKLALRAALVLFFSGARVFCQASTETISLPAVADTSLFETNPDNNLGGADSLAAGTTREGRLSRALLQFDLTGALPSNAVIVSAELRLDVTKLPASGAAGSVFALHRLLVEWGEGNKQGTTGSPGSENEATWNARLGPNNRWGIPGGAASGDYLAALSSSRFMDQVGSYVFNSTSNLVADLQAWLGRPAENFGWILISEREDLASTARRIGAREANSAGSPGLSVTFTIPAPIAPPRIELVTQASDRIHLGFMAAASLNYVVEFAENLGEPWNILTNIESHVSTTNVLVNDSIGLRPRRFYRVGAKRRD